MAGHTGREVGRGGEKGKAASTQCVRSNQAQCHLGFLGVCTSESSHPRAEEVRYLPSISITSIGHRLLSGHYFSCMPVLSQTRPGMLLQLGSMCESTKVSKGMTLQARAIILSLFPSF